MNRERLTKFFLEGKRGLLIKGGLLYADGPGLTKSAAWFGAVEQVGSSWIGYVSGFSWRLWLFGVGMNRGLLYWGVKTPPIASRVIERGGEYWEVIGWTRLYGYTWRILIGQLVRLRDLVVFIVRVGSGTSGLLG